MKRPHPLWLLTLAVPLVGVALLPRPDELAFLRGGRPASPEAIQRADREWRAPFGQGDGREWGRGFDVPPARMLAELRRRLTPARGWSEDGSSKTRTTDAQGRTTLVETQRLFVNRDTGGYVDLIDHQGQKGSPACTVVVRETHDAWGRLKSRVRGTFAR